MCAKHTDRVVLPIVQFLSENSRAFGTLFSESYSLLSYARKSMSSIYILFALFTLYFVVHLTVTYTSRLSSLVL